MTGCASLKQPDNKGKPAPRRDLAQPAVDLFKVMRVARWLPVRVRTRAQLRVGIAVKRKIERHTGSSRGSPQQHNMQLNRPMRAHLQGLLNVRTARRAGNKVDRAR